MRARLTRKVASSEKPVNGSVPAGAVWPRADAFFALCNGLCTPATCGFGYWAAETLAGGEFIGGFVLRPVTPTDGAIEYWPDASGDTGVASLGYRLRRSAWGQGYATEGARALVRLAFTGLGVREIVATTMAVNAGSRRVMEKAGLRYARTVHLDWPEPLPGNEHGDVEYRLLREEWLDLCATTAPQAAPAPDAGGPGVSQEQPPQRPWPR